MVERRRLELRPPLPVPELRHSIDSRAGGFDTGFVRSMKDSARLTLKGMFDHDSCRLHCRVPRMNCGLETVRGCSSIGMMVPDSPYPLSIARLSLAPASYLGTGLCQPWPGDMWDSLLTYAFHSLVDSTIAKKRGVE